MPDDIGTVRGERPAGGMFREWEQVKTVDAVDGAEGMLPPGSEGTIIDASPVSDWFEVEFLAPFHCILTLMPGQISRLD